MNKKTKITRSNFLKTSSLGVLSMGMTPAFGKDSFGMSKSNQSKDLPDLGIVGWTFNYVPTPKAIEMMKGLGVKKTTLKPSVQLPVGSSKSMIKNVVGMYKDAGISIYGVGVIYMETEEETDQAFEYAKNVGVPILVAAPKHDLLDYIEKNAKEYDIKVAIHNHGPDDTGGGHFPGAKDVYEKVENRDSRMGLCYDIGHGTRAGENAPEAITKYQDRIYDMHFKDVTKNTGDGKSIKIGGSDGVIDFPDVIKALADINYSGEYSLEYEDNMKDPLSDVAQSIGYLTGVKDVITS